MMILFWLGVLVVALLSKRSPRRAVKLLYKDQARIVNGEAVFPCGCRFHLTAPAGNFICHSHQAIIAAEVEA